MSTIYFADDEKEIRDVVTSFLKNEGYEVKTFQDGDKLFAKFIEKPCDLVLLDIMMPGTDGIGILTEIRKVSKVPIILLTAKDTDSDYYSGLSLGSDDYITKPFKPIILLAKINALLRRVRFEKEIQTGAIKTDKELRCGNLYYSELRHEVKVNDEIVNLTPTELKFLVYLMEHYDEAVGKGKILDVIWDMNYEVETRVADETNRRLRKKLTRAGADVYVETIWGYGFKLTDMSVEI
ncbi:response regulator transcription factor [Tissierella praeacuta]|uniref:response regulator transcription factor n=1 Tax=Tissierella praeacuta TaxID=43131 RepID=UPI00333E4A8B